MGEIRISPQNRTFNFILDTYILHFNFGITDSTFQWKYYKRYTLLYKYLFPIIAYINIF